MAFAPLMLADPGLVPTSDGHAYVFSRMPDKLELMAIFDALRAHEDRYDGDVATVEYDGTTQVFVTGLNMTARPVIEAALFDGCMAAYDAMVAEPGYWTETKAIERAPVEEQVRATFNRLPVDLP
jgi:hypothetical protein